MKCKTQESVKKVHGTMKTILFDKSLQCKLNVQTANEKMEIKCLIDLVQQLIKLEILSQYLE